MPWLPWLALLVCSTGLGAQERTLLLPVQKAILLPPVLNPPPPLDPKTIPKLWSGGAELGLNGAEGNSTNMRMRAAGNIKRETPGTIFKGDWLYTFATQNSTRSENRGLLNSRQEWILANARWSVFASGQNELDEFKAYDMRLAAHSGMGFNFVKNDSSLIKGRLGLGGSQEIGGPNSKLLWEALGGFDLEHKFNARYKAIASVEYFPNILDFNDFRLQGKLSLEVLIDPTLNLSLKMGVLDRYDSTPEGRLPNDAEYFAVLLWKF